MTPIVGAIIEGIATCLCRLASKTLAEKGPKYANILDSFIGTSLVVAGKLKSHPINWAIVLLFSIFYFEAFNFSGGYFNPVLATSLKWGCSGHTGMEHVIVYWIGACVGAILSVPIFRHPYVRNLLLGEKTKED